MKIKFALFVVVFLIFMMGAVMIFNTTSAEVLDKELISLSYIQMMKQVAFALFGSFVGFIIYRIGYKKLIDKAHLIFAFVTLLLLIVLVPSLGMQINGARRWINVGGISLQPSEFMKVALPLFYLRLYFQKEGEKDFLTFFRWSAYLLVPILFIIVEPDNGTAFILLTTCIVLYFITRIRTLYWVIPLALVCTMGVILALSMKHVSDRIYVYMHPEADLLGKGHQPYQAKIAVGSGGLFGRGLGESLQKLQYLPESRSDYIAAIFAEEFGFVGMFVLIFLYLLVGALGFTIALKAEDEQGFYLATIFTYVIVFQAFINLGIVSGILPSKGTNLPFFSQGGSSLLSNIFLLSLIMNTNQSSKIWIEKKSL